MELVPPYLAAYLWRIRKHSGEIGYFKRTLEPKGEERAVYEKSMLAQLEKLGLVSLTDDEDELVFDPHVFDWGGVRYERVGTERKVTVPRGFHMLARGHWLWTEYLVCGGRWLFTAFLGGAIGTLVTIYLGRRFG